MKLLGTAAALTEAGTPSTPTTKATATRARHATRLVAEAAIPPAYPRASRLTRHEVGHPAGASMNPSPGRVAQRESARLTRERSLVRTQPRPSITERSRDMAAAR